MLDWHLELLAREDAGSGSELLSLFAHDEGVDVYGYGDSVIAAGPAARDARVITAYDEVADAYADALLDELGKRDVQQVLVEGGPTLAWELVARDLVDEVVLFFAPILVGGQDAPSILMGGGIPTIGDPVRLEVIDVSPIGRDIKVEARVHRDR